MSLDDKVAGLMSAYGRLTRQILPGFLQDPSSNNLEIRDQITGPDGQGVVDAPPGFARKALYTNIAAMENTIKGVIDAPENIYDFMIDPKTHGNSKPKPLVTEETYAAYKKDKKLSPEGEKAFYMSIMQNKTLQKELAPMLKEKEPEKFKEYMQAWGFSQTIKRGLAQGNIDNVLAFIQQATGGDVAALMQGHMKYGSQESVKLIAMHIAEAAEKRAAALYETTKGELSKIVDGAIKKTGTLGYVEAILDWNQIYSVEAQQQPEKSAPSKPKLYAVPDVDEAEQGAA